MAVAPSTANYRSFFNARTRKSANAGAPAIDHRPAATTARTNRSIRRRHAESENRSMETRHRCDYIRARVRVTRAPANRGQSRYRDPVTDRFADGFRKFRNFAAVCRRAANANEILHIYGSHVSDTCTPRSYSSRRSLDLFKSSFYFIPSSALEMFVVQTMKINIWRKCTKLLISNSKRIIKEFRALTKLICSNLGRRSLLSSEEKST